MFSQIANQFGIYFVALANVWFAFYIGGAIAALLRNRQRATMMRLATGSTMAVVERIAKLEAQLQCVLSESNEFRRLVRSAGRA